MDRSILTRMASFLMLAIIFCGTAARGQDAGTDGRNATSGSSLKTLTVAVLTFDAQDPANPDMGAQLSEIVTVTLSGDDRFVLVDRTKLDQTLAEHELSLSGMTSTDQAVQVGKLVGARILVTGRLFSLGKNTYLTAKLVGTETSRVEAVMVKGDAEQDVGELAMQLAGKISERVVADARKLTGDYIIKADPLLKLIAAAKKMKYRPTIALVITEEHLAGPRPVTMVAQPPDPAVETELKRILIQAGFTIKDVKANELADWAPKDAWPRHLEGVDLVITGKAMSEFGSRIGNLVSCAARAEINLIQRTDGKIVLSERNTSRAIDLAEQIAGKTALQKTGYKLAIPVMEYLLKSPWNQP